MAVDRPMRGSRGAGWHVGVLPFPGTELYKALEFPEQ